MNTTSATFGYATFGHATSGHASQGIVALITAAIAGAMARAKARHEYRRLLECDEILRDVGVSRDAVRKALTESGGRF